MLGNLTEIWVALDMVTVARVAPKDTCNPVPSKLVPLSTTVAPEAPAAVVGASEVATLKAGARLTTMNSVAQVIGPPPSVVMVTGYVPAAKAGTTTFTSVAVKGPDGAAERPPMVTTGVPTLKLTIGGLSAAL